MSANTQRISSFSRRPISSIALEFIAGLVVLIFVSILLHGIGHSVTDWICTIVGGLLVLHALFSLLAKGLRHIRGGATIMTILIIVCLSAAMASPSFGDSNPEQQGSDGFGGYTVYPMDQDGCRTIVGWSTGTYPQLVVSAHPLHISFSGVDYVWPVTVSYCTATVTTYASDNTVLSQQQILYGVRINKDQDWQQVDGGVVQNYSFTGAKAVYHNGRSCVNIRVHARVQVKIPPAVLPHWILPASFVTKPWIEFDNLCSDGSYGQVRHDREPA
jgi:hypothetical protein